LWVFFQHKNFEKENNNLLKQLLKKNLEIIKILTFHQEQLDQVFQKLEN